MKAEDFKKEVKNILKSEVKFDGHVDVVINNISEEKQKAMLEWINDCALGKNKPEPCKNFRSLISFIYKSNDNRIRGILTKEKNSFFVELFIDKHKYYDRKRRYLGI